jgi:hypothetical protein
MPKHFGGDPFPLRLGRWYLLQKSIHRRGNVWFPPAAKFHTN